VARYDTAIPPGGEGKITLKLNPKACGQDTKKSILVTCNDPQKPYFILILKGQASG
jgi:hypothetical protein